MRALFLASALSFSAAGCSSCNKDDAPARGVDAAASAVVVVADAAPVVAAAVDAGGPVLCQPHGELQIVDTGVRAETGVQLALDGDRILVGYAKTNGAPAVAALTPDDTWKKSAVQNTLAALEAKPEAGVQRTVWRVVPLTASDTDAEVAVDYTEVLADKSVHVRCGSSHGAPEVDYAGPAVTQGADGGTETVSCRSVRGPKGELALWQSTLTLDGTTLSATLGPASAPAVLQRDTPLKANEKANGRFAYSRYDVRPFGASQLITARYNGTVLVVPPDQKLGEGGKADASSYAWLGAAANGLAVATTDARALVLVTAQGKGELWSFGIQAEPDSKTAGKPLKVVAHAPSSPISEREILDLARAGEQWFALLAETQDGMRQVRLRGFDDSLNDAPGVPLDIGASGKGVVDAKILQLTTNETLVAYLTLDKTGYVVKSRRYLCGGQLAAAQQP
jgi:hypothetical protein